MHNKAWFGCFFAPSRLQIRSPQACKAAKRSRKCTVSPRFPNPPQTVKKKATIPPLFRPWFPFSSQPYHTVKSYSCIHTYQHINLITNILATNSHSCSTSQITISLIANQRPFYHRPPTDTPIRHGVYRGAQYWDKPHRRYR